MQQVKGNSHWQAEGSIRIVRTGPAI